MSNEFYPAYAPLCANVLGTLVVDLLTCHNNDADKSAHANIVHASNTGSNVSAGYARDNPTKEASRKGRLHDLRGSFKILVMAFACRHPFNSTDKLSLFFVFFYLYFSIIQNVLVPHMTL